MLIGTIFHTYSLRFQRSENAQYSSSSVVFMCRPEGKSHLEDITCRGTQYKTD